MTGRKDILELHKKQLNLEIDAIRSAIHHSAIKGSEAEGAFKSFIRKHLPHKYKIGSGFVSNSYKMSQQHDIIFYDDFINTPIFLSDNSGVFLGGSVYGVAEITITKLNSTKLKTDIKKLANLRHLFPEDKVAFQKVISFPIVDENELKNEVGCYLSSGIFIDDVWPEIKKKCISEEGAFVGDVYSLVKVDDYEKDTIFNVVQKYSNRAKKYVVKEKTIYSTPPPRTYLCALNGVSYKSIDSLCNATKKLTKKYRAHLHGLLVLNKEGDDWLLSTKAYSNHEVQVTKKDAFLKFLDNIKRDFQCMLVGKKPASEPMSFGETRDRHS